VYTQLLIASENRQIDLLHILMTMGETMELSLMNREIYDLAVNGVGKLTGIASQFRSYAMPALFFHNTYA
jgi:hypothetical protein